MYAFVKRWMDAHQEMGGIWDVFDEQLGLDVIVSVNQSAGARQLALPGQQAATSLTPEAETQILDWLDNLASQPRVPDPRR